MKNSSFSSMQKIRAEDSEIVKNRKQKTISGSYERISDKLNVPGEELLDSQGGLHIASIPPFERFRGPRQSRGNQALNDGLKMKANELEKLFAKYKRAELSVKSQDRRSGALESTSKLPFINTMIEAAGSCSCRNVVNFDGKAPVKMVKNQNYGDSIRLNFLALNFGNNNSRGNFMKDTCRNGMPNRGRKNGVLNIGEGR